MKVVYKDLDGLPLTRHYLTVISLKISNIKKKMYLRIHVFIYKYKEREREREGVVVVCDSFYTYKCNTIGKYT